MSNKLLQGENWVGGWGGCMHTSDAWSTWLMIGNLMAPLLNTQNCSFVWSSPIPTTYSLTLLTLGLRPPSILGLTACKNAVSTQGRGVTEFYTPHLLFHDPSLPMRIQTSLRVHPKHH